MDYIVYYFLGGGGAPDTRPDKSPRTVELAPSLRLRAGTRVAMDAELQPICPGRSPTPEQKLPASTTMTETMSAAAVVQQLLHRIPLTPNSHLFAF